MKEIIINTCKLPKAKTIRLYLGSAGFDTVYDKGKIKVYGLCQSLVYDVNAI